MRWSKIIEQDELIPSELRSATDLPLADQIRIKPTIRPPKLESAPNRPGLSPLVRLGRTHYFSSTSPTNASLSLTHPSSVFSCSLRLGSGP